MKIKMEKKNYKQEILRLTGWTPERYDKEYDKYRLRVRQFERETGNKKINVAASFYYTKRDEARGKALSPQKQAILLFVRLIITIDLVLTKYIFKELVKKMSRMIISL